MTLDEITFAGPFRVAQLRFVTEDGQFYRACRSPGDDLSGLHKEVQEKIAAEWTPEIVEAQREAVKEVPAEPEPLSQPDPRDVKIAALEATVTLLRARLDKIDGGDGILPTRR